MGENLTAWPKDRTVAIPIPVYLIDVRPAEKQWTSTAEVNTVLSRYERVLIRYEKDAYKLLVGEWLILVAPDTKMTYPDRMKFFGLSKATAASKREFLRGSVCIEAKSGWGVMGKSSAAFDYTPVRTRVFAAFLAQLQVALGRLNQAKAPAFDLEAQRIVDTLAAYNNMELELEREAVQGTAEYLYRQVEPVTAVRIARIPYRFTLESPSDLVEGDLLQVALKNGQTISGLVTSVTPTTVTVAFSGQFDFHDLPRVGLLKPAPNEVQHRVRAKVLEELGDGTTRATYLLPVMAHGRYMAPQGQAPAGPLSDKLNAAQLKAVQLGDQVNDLLLVLGPPGTGKTTVIAEWVYHYAAQGQRLLISSKNNAAVDNVLERLLDDSKRPPGTNRLRVMRVGNEDYVAASVREVLLDNQAATLQKDMLARSKQALGPFLQATPLVAGYAAALSQYSAVLRAKLQSEQALGQAQKTVIQRWQPQLESTYRQLQRVQRRGQQLLGRETRWQNIEESLFTLKQKNRLASWLLAAPVSIAHWTRNRVQLEISGAILAESDLLRYYEHTWHSVEAEWHSPDMIALKAHRWESEEGATRLAPQVDAAHRAAALAVEGVPGFGVPRSPVGQSVEVAVTAQREAESALNRLQSVASTTGEWQRALDSGRRQVLYGLLLRMVDVVGATCIGINSDRRFADVDFDVTIVDEAGQIQAHDVIVPLSRSPKAIMVGDHKQLPPMVDKPLEERAEAASVDTEMLKKSLFELLYPQAPETNKVLLDTQYRMPAEMADFISEQFYQGQYKSPDFKRGLGPLLPFCRKPLCLVDTSQEADRRERYRNPGYENALEADIVAAIVVAAYQAGVGFNDLGVITPYGHQAALIYRLLTQEYQLVDETGVLRDNIATVDSFQGQERKLIIYTFTRSNRTGAVGFLSELRRLNVALTRPQAQLVMVGDFQTLARATDPEFSRLIHELVRVVETTGDYSTAEAIKERLTNVHV